MPTELAQMVLFSLINPGVIAAGLLVGRAADQVEKIVVGAFAAAIAGLLVAWLGLRLGLPVGLRQPRNVAGLFVLSWFLGLAWSWIGFRFLKAR